MVTKKPKGLGLGLEALLGPKVDDTRKAPLDGAPATLKLAVSPRLMVDHDDGLFVVSGRAIGAALADR